MATQERDNAIVQAEEHLRISYEERLEAKEAQLRDTKMALSVAMEREAETQSNRLQVAASLARHARASIPWCHEELGVASSGSAGARRFLCAIPTVSQQVVASGDEPGVGAMNDVVEEGDGRKEATCEGQGEDNPAMRGARGEMWHNEELVVAACSTEARQSLCATPTMSQRETEGEQKEEVGAVINRVDHEKEAEGGHKEEVGGVIRRVDEEKEGGQEEEEGGGEGRGKTCKGQMQEEQVMEMAGVVADARLGQGRAMKVLQDGVRLVHEEITSAAIPVLTTCTGVSSVEKMHRRAGFATTHIFTSFPRDKIIVFIFYSTS